MKSKSQIKKGIVLVLVAIQLAAGLAFIPQPKPAQAFLGIGDFTFNYEVGNGYDILKDIAIGAAQRIAISYANKYIQQFVDQVVDKYRIKDYLAYDKVLSGYYLNQLIYKNVDDPDLRAIYGILATDVNTRATVTDPVTGKKIPVLAALREKLDQYYYNTGGINSSLIYYPGASVTDEQYFQAAQAYFAYPPSFSDQNLYGHFGQLVADSQKAAGTEESLSNGLKNDRSAPTGVVPHICNNFDDTWADYLKNNPRNSQADCAAAGGTWDVDKNGLLSSAIQNPASFIHDFANNAINSLFTNNFGVRDNIYTTIGSLIGNFIFTKLTLTQPGGTLNESGTVYVPPATPAATIKDIDIDGDGIPDAQDSNADGQPDFCIYGGVPVLNADGSVSTPAGPPCLGSREALSNPAPPPPPPPAPATLP